MAAIDDDKGRITRSRSGDPDAFESLIREHQKMIYSLCYRMSGSAADAADLAQDTFVRAFQRIDSFRSEAKFSSWLYRIAMNECLNWRKANTRRSRLHKEWSEEPNESETQPDVNSQQIQAALLKLHPKQRAAVILTIYEGLNHAEAARMLGCSEATVSWRLFAARKKLKQLLRHLHYPESKP
jgi:RNA polymerase sigma-70 factor (ECF subfamily)